MKKILSLLFLSIIPLGLIASEYPDISINDLQKAIKKGNVAIIDVNGDRTYENGHIPSAIHFPSVGKKLSKSLPKDKNTLIVSYCGGPGCRAYKRGADAAAKLGYKNIKHLSAGISGWKKAGAEISKK